MRRIVRFAGRPIKHDATAIPKRRKKDYLKQRPTAQKGTPMPSIRRADDRGRANFGWLDSRHSFSFGTYHDPDFMGFGPLRVINEDRVQPGRGFDTHGHRDMEIISYVLEGALEHRDNLGNGSIIRPGEIQRMSAGTGIMHSEYNHSTVDPVHFLQIWIEPNRRGLAPGYEQRPIPAPGQSDGLRLIASSDGRDGSVTIHQDVALYTALLDPGQHAAHDMAPGRRAWIQLTQGSVNLGEAILTSGDGAALTADETIAVTANAPSELLLFDLP